MPKMRGAYPSPRHVLAAAIPHTPRADLPDHFGVLPAQLSVWGNDTYGDCVSAEEAAAKAIYSAMGGGPEVFVDQQTLIQWARNHGVLNGADLASVIDMVIQDGITASDGKLYHDGGRQSVNWTDDATLSSAIFTGPVKIAVAANQFENAHQSNNGWFATGFYTDQNTDHCVALCGFGTAAQLAAICGVSVPAGVDPNTRCYLVFTWGSIGIIDRNSMIAVTNEAWLRTPTTPEGPQPGPAPTPAPTPGPNPAPTPTPTPTPPSPAPAIGPDQVLIDLAARTIKMGANLSARHNFLPTVVVHPKISKVDVPAGFTLA